MSRKKSMLDAPVPQAEIEKKLPMCSMFCTLSSDCPHRINLQTESPIIMALAKIGALEVLDHS